MEILLFVLGYQLLVSLFSAIYISTQLNVRTAKPKDYANWCELHNNLAYMFLVINMPLSLAVMLVVLLIGTEKETFI